MAGETFELRFRNNEDITVSIDEPINFATVDFQLSQKEKGYGRDVSFNGGEVQFEFVNYRKHYLGKLLEYNNNYGFESVVELIITSGTISTVIGDLDFATSVTDDLEYFKCKVIQQASKQVIKRRKGIKIDLLSDKDVDGNYIEPLAPENVLLLSKPIYQVSNWVQTSDLSFSYSNLGRSMNPAQSLTKYGVDDSYTFYEAQGTDPNLFKALTATTKLKDISVNFNNINFSASGGFDKSVTVRVRYGLTFASSTDIYAYQKYVPSGDISFNTSTSTIIPFLNKGESIWAFIFIGQTIAYTLDVNVTGMSMDINAKSYTNNSVVPAFRLIDVMKQVIKSISGSSLVSDRFDVGGEFYNNFIFNGNSLRAIPDEPFSVSLDDLEKSIVEMNADYEIKPNGDIFFGIEDDFYSDLVCGTFTNTQFSSFNKTFNPRFQINEFNYGYKKFQSLNENEEPNSADVIHGESKWVLVSKSVENKKDISIEWTRDSFLIETNRRKALEITSDTASKNDTDLFIVDTIATESDVTYTEKNNFLHSVGTGKLILTSDKSVNFIVLGIKLGSVFEITSGLNVGLYNVDEVSDSSITLFQMFAGTVVGDIEPVLTTYNYTLTINTIPNTVSLDEGFSNISNLVSFDKFANLKYSLRRNIELYWKKYLTTCNLYNRDKSINNTWYKNNNLFGATYSGISLIENQAIKTGLQMPILSPFIYNDVVFSNVEFVDFIALQNSIRIKRGYILTKGVNGFPLKLYPTSMKYENLSKQLTIQGEEKFASTFKPTVITYDVTDISTNSCIAGGEIVSDGYTTITNKGVVWSLLQNPTIDLVTKTSLGAGAGSFTSYISGLSSNTTYYVRAYGTNANGTSYGSQITFKTKTTDYQTIDYSSSDYSVEFISFEPLIKAFYTRVLADNGSVECPQELINILDKLNSI